MEIGAVMTDFLRLRHSLIPYLYTMNHRAYAENIPLILPMYYSYPKNREAYSVKNQYEFGTAFVVAPITTPEKAGINRGKVSVWLPEGLYMDFFTGMIYSGGRMLDMYRDIHSIPVLARAGAIVPMTEEILGTAAVHNPESLTIRIYGGADGSFTLYEDDNETNAYMKGEAVNTKMDLNWEKKCFTISPAEGKLELVPSKRTVKVQFFGVKDSDVKVTIGGKEVSAEKTYDAHQGCLTVMLPEAAVTEKITVTMADGGLRSNDVDGMIFDLLDRGELGFHEKEAVYALTQKKISTAAKLAELQALDLDAELIGAVSEILTAYEV